jgi:hypothetical protein
MDSSTWDFETIGFGSGLEHGIERSVSKAMQETVWGQGSVDPFSRAQMPALVSLSLSAHPT